MSAVGQDVHRDIDNDGTEDECEFKDASGNVVNPGSRCDEFKNKCDIPLYDRTTKTTPLYYGPTAAPDLFATTAQALNSWNIAVKRAVQLGKAVEATRVNVDVGQTSPGYLTSEADLLADQQNGHHRPGHLRPLPQPGDRGRQRRVRALRAWRSASAIFATASSTSSPTRRSRRPGAS